MKVVLAPLGGPSTPTRSTRYASSLERFGPNRRADKGRRCFSAEGRIHVAGADSARGLAAHPRRLDVVHPAEFPDVIRVTHRRRLRAAERHDSAGGGQRALLSGPT